jgi:site-specific DNA-methyltransferase (adenine-specific)
MGEIVRIGDATLYHADCRDVLPTLANIDVVITDPPYGARTHAGARTGGSGRADPTSGKLALIDFDSLPDEVFLPLCVQLVGISRRWVVMSCEWRHAAQLEESEILVRLGVWIKRNGAPQFTGDRPGVGWEAISCLHRPGRKRWNGGGHHAVWDVPKVDGFHPTGKPIALLAKWVEQFTDVGETVLDPFMGSGTTGVACIQSGRAFTGIERERKYFDVACERISRAQAQGVLFKPLAAKPEQQQLAAFA